MNMAEEPLLKTIPIALLLHVLLLFGVGFMPEMDPRAKLAPVLDITLLQTHSDETPDKVDFIAQTNQQASGSSDKKNRPQSPLSSLLPTDVEGESPVQSEAGSPDEPLKLTPEILTTKGETYKRVEKSPEQPDKDRPVAEQVADSTQEVAQLLAEVNEDEARYARRPRIHFIDAVSAKSAVEAEYIDDWVKKIERIGNINFPEEAIVKNLSGKLILNATLDQAGRVVDAQISLSSGYDLLDKTALRIVKLAAPYPPLPEEIRRKWDQLNITRTWVFHSGSLNTQ
jgi:protein TonB